VLLLCAPLAAHAAGPSKAPGTPGSPVPPPSASSASAGSAAAGSSAAAPATPPALPAKPDEAPKTDQPAAATPKPGAVSVAQLLRDSAALRALVLKKSPQVAAADARIVQAQADVGTAHLLPNPTVDMSAGGILVGSPNPTSGQNYGQTASFDVGVSEMIEIGKRGPRIEAANNRLESVKAQAQSSTQDAVGDAREALGKVAYYAARSALLEEGVAAARKGASIEHAKLEQGGTAGVDYERLSLEVIQLETEAARGKTDLSGAIALCQSLLRSPCDETGAAEDDLDAAADVPAAPIEDKLEDRADIRAVRKEADAAKADAELARARIIPDPTFRLGYTHQQDILAGNQPNTLTLSVSLPIPLFDHGQHDAAKATAHATELEHTATSMVAGATSDVTSLRQRKAYLESALATMKKDAVPKAQRVVNVTEKAFAEGQVGLTDLLLARRSYLGLRLSQIDLTYESFTVRSSLRRALGIDSAPR
jgi:cobalt-zinc-cadmium efflux system outer membrane protein